MAPSPIELPGITWLVLQGLQGVISTSIDVVGAPARADTQGPSKEHALTFMTPAPVSLTHVITTLNAELVPRRS
jgi:hypothetical protein